MGRGATKEKVLRLRVGGRYVTRGGGVIRISGSRPIDASQMRRRPPAGWRTLCLGYFEGEEAQPYAWFENGRYGAHTDHPFTVISEYPE